MDSLLNQGDTTNMLYFAYGMNTNEESMATRCPKAKYLGNYTLYKFLFQFRRVADIDYTGNKKDKVIGTVWDISKDCEKSLDILEGYPTFYTKEYIKTKKGRMMFYIMTARNKTRLETPSRYYYKMLYDGYREHKIKTHQLISSYNRADDFERLTEKDYQWSWSFESPIKIIKRR